MIQPEQSPLAETLYAPDIPEVTVHHVVTEDEYISDPETFAYINDQVEELMGMGYKGDPSVNIERKRRGNIDRDNPATKELMRRLPSFGDWLDMVPTAGALDALYHPDQKVFANGRPVDSELAKWLRNIADGRGIRSRGATVHSILRDEALINTGYSPSWLSLASGAAQPVIAAGLDVYRMTETPPKITLVDRDERALNLACEYAERAGISESLQTKRMNILRPQGLGYAREQNESDIAKNALHHSRGDRLLRESYDVVEAVGIVEYLQAENSKYEYKDVISTKRPVAGACTFLKNSYDLVRPGGLMVVGNMLDTHPQLGFTLNTIQWPHIQPRSIEQMSALFQEAGVQGEIDVYVPEDGVYGVYTIRKAKE